MTQARLLLVEDEGIIADDLRSHLRRMGHPVAGIASSGEEALALVEALRPDLILMDIGLAGDMDGIETAAAIRARFDIPIVFLTAHADAATLERAKSVAPAGYLAKPFQPLSLGATVEMALHNAELTRQLKASEARLARESWRYQQLLRTSTDAIYILDQTGQLRECNPAFLAHLGCSAEQAAGLNVSDWNAEWTPEALRAKIAELIQTPARFETLHRRQDGALIPVEINASGVLLEGEHLLYASARDITERKQMEAELTAERDFAQSVLRTMGQGLTVTDGQSRFEYVNPAYARFIGYQPEELVGRHPAEFTHASDQATLAQAGQDRQAGQTTSYETRLIHKSGARVDALITGVPRWRTGQVRGAVAVITDLSERKQMEAALRRERQHLRAVIDASREGVALVGTDGSLYVINQPALDFLGISGAPRAWVGRKTEELLAELPPGEAASLIHTEQARWESGDEAPNDGAQEYGGRALRWFNLPVRSGEQTLGRLIVLRDVTPERELENMREDLTRTMVHDLRNPLAALRGALAVFDLDGVEGLSADQREMLTTMDEQTRRMLTLVSSILDVSQLESGSMPLERTAVRLSALIEEALHLQAPLAAQQQVRLLPTLAADLPPVSADAGLLARVLQNLLGNALKFTPAGGTVWVTAEAEAGGVRVTVRDDGPGIAADVRPRLFQKFAAGQVKGRGSGLGLAFCRLVVEAHGGRIGVESAPGQGSAFHFSLPAGASQ